MTSAYSFPVNISPGSLTAISDATGKLVESLSYDPWGRRRNPNDWNDYNVSSTLFDRGFTGHEHLPQFGLINMNGRVYDPFLARFLSPDPFVQAPDYSQNYNRYSYALNNPLKYTDPDGEWAHLVVGAVIGGVVNWAANGAEFSAKGLGHFGVGALAGALGAGIGAGFGTLAAGSGSFGFMVPQGLAASGFAAGAAAGAGAGFSSGLVTGVGNSLLNGEDFSSALSEGVRSAAIGGLVGGFTGGISGGIRASRFGNDFWSGNGAGGKYGKVSKVDVGRMNYRASQISTRNMLSKMNKPIASYTDSHLEFNGSQIDLINNYCDGYQCVADSWDAVSGPWGNGPLPKGDWFSEKITLLDPLTQPNFESYSKENFGFWMKLNSTFNTTRVGIGYHPDGGTFFGTSGCIGLTGAKSELVRFYNTLSGYLENRWGIYTIVK